MDVVEAARKGAGVPWSAIDTIVVNVGPGTFTGIRAGVAAARGLALSLGVPAVGVTTFRAFEAHREVGGPLTVALDARRGQVYAQAFDGGGKALVDAIVGTPERVLDALEDAAAHGSLAGSGAEALLAARPGTELGIAMRDGEPWLDAHPDVAAVAAAAAAGHAIVAEPLYLRAADARPARDAGLRQPAGDRQEEIA